ncbi:MAG: glycoside-pentoside-hexuronide (GPH):cation symporter [Firmicutes bacterium]|nr:glycoside-pentoside-hexuronide (GPH):cation symporter [Bacillota bacterium]
MALSRPPSSRGGAVRLSRLTKLAYGFGDAGMSASSTVINFFFLYYLTEVAGLRPAVAGAAIFAGRLYDAVTDPFEGYLSDRTVSRWGRRRPYFLFGAVPFGLTFALMFSCPRLESQVALAVFAGLAYVLHMTAYTGIGVPYTALTAELTRDYDERTSLTAYRMAFSIVFGLLAAVAPLPIVGLFRDPWAGYRAMGLAFGLFMVLPPLGVFWACREADRPGETPLSGRPKVGLGEFLGETLLTLRNRPFRAALAVYLLTWVAIDVVQAVFLYFLDHVMGLESAAEGIFGLLFVVAAASLPLWVWVSGRWDKKVAYLAGAALLGGVLVAVAFLRPGMVGAAYALAAVAGVGVSAAHVSPWSMVPDCIEYDELTTGRRREGQHYGFLTFAQKLASSGAIFLTGAVLEAAGYVAGSAQPASALAAMRLLLGPAPAAALGLAALVLLAFPVGRAEHARLLAALEARQAEGGVTAAGPAATTGAGQVRGD